MYLFVYYLGQSLSAHFSRMTKLAQAALESAVVMAVGIVIAGSLMFAFAQNM
ncbi:MAG: hypothetical protein JWN64_474 [Parcubacteria group bacterium]|nr:hypothetical protein [Parcubacteria group bacterium]